MAQNPDTLPVGKDLALVIPISGEARELEYNLAQGDSLSLYLVYDAGSSSGANASSIKITVNLDGKDARVKIRGICRIGGNDSCRIQTIIRHNCPDCRSEQLFKNVATDCAKVDFDGRIYVAQGSFGTDASQQCHSLLLSDKAIVSTSPQLEIYADDVKCSHGATIGKLDENALFYMQSRGISLEVARALQIESFLNEINDCEPDTPLYDELLAVLDRCRYSETGRTECPS